MVRPDISGLEALLAVVDGFVSIDGIVAFSGVLISLRAMLGRVCSVDFILLGFIHVWP